MLTRTRTTLGDKFNEGARLLWEALASGEWSVPALAKATGSAKATIFRVLYGDRRPNLDLANAFSKLLSIPTEAWSQSVADYTFPTEALAELSSAPAPGDSSTDVSEAAKPHNPNAA